jgi:hypothetical protein
MAGRLITLERLRALLSYDPDTGLFQWIAPTSNRVCKGAIAGVKDKSTGYVRIRLDDTLYHAHRLAWLYMTGEWPTDQIDHISRVKTDNRWSNLRQATQAENKRNLPVMRSNTSGVPGVTWFKRDQCWRAQIHYQGRGIALGYFSNFDDAVAARKAAEARYFGEFRAQ